MTDRKTDRGTGERLNKSLPTGHLVPSSSRQIVNDSAPTGHLVPTAPAAASSAPQTGQGGVPGNSKPQSVNSQQSASSKPK
jgi:hypothetical protein